MLDHVKAREREKSVFVRFGSTKGEIRVKKGDFRGDLVFFLKVWTLFGKQPPHPPTFGKDIKKKRFFFIPSLIVQN